MSKFYKKQFEKIILEAIKRAEIDTSPDVFQRLKECHKEESSSLAKFQLDVILRNLEIAKKRKIPRCQDTGIPIFFIKIGNKVKINFDIKKILTATVRKATKEIPLRKNVVHPITRENTGENTGLSFPYVWFDYFMGDYIEIDYLPKGGGTENMSCLRMFDSITEFKEVEDFIITTAIDFSGKCCPPYILGVGIGGTSDIAMYLAKKATMRKIGSRNTDPAIAAVEHKLFKIINSLGIGPMGMGGICTLLALNIEIAGVHTSVYPVGITNQCWKVSHSKVRWRGDARYKFL